jgi:thioesterase domain-containing protein
MAPSPSVSSEAPSPLIRFRDGCRAGSVVMLPGLCANVGNPTAPGGKDFPGVTPLADRLGGNGAIYIVDFVSLAEGVCGPLSVEDLAAHALSLVSASGGVDAYVGYSFGGLVALEMARLSGAQDVPPIKTILIDTAFDQSYWPRAMWLMSMWLRVLQYARAFTRMPVRQAAAELRLRIRGLIARVRQRGARGAGDKISLTVSGEVAETPALRNLAHAHFDYRPAPVAAPFTLLECSDPSYGTPTSHVWRPLAPNLRVVKYPGNHYDVVYSDAGADVLAAHLNACLGVAS